MPEHQPRRADVRYGDGLILTVPELVAEFDARRVLLVCGRSSFQTSGAAAMLPALAGAAELRRWSDFSPNPDVAELARGLAVVAEFQPDLVLGIGGGSALDLAKLLVSFPPGTGGDQLAERVRAGRAESWRRPRLVLAPTTSGSGSEATHFSVVYIGAEKFSVASPAMRADVVVLDPTLSRTGTPYQRATSGIDAVAQAIESLWAVAGTPASRRWASHALGLLLPAIENFVVEAEPGAASSRAMTIGSHLAGRAIDTSRTTAAHALSYGITQRYGVSHGHAVALTLGGFLAEHSDPAPARLRAEVTPGAHAAVMAEIQTRLGATDGVTAQQRWRELMRQLGLNPSLTAAGVATDAERAALVDSVNVERLGNNPVTFTEVELGRLLADLD
ncbi:phosphonoacetaldehyde reductase [Natronosporangium hydrolyticum]|uniref:Phosphonoacetaldehyde reductase n=1 Tax=Natronosporangium hydrolyticum TaxID=2811111 RepID=A0A895YGN0_9ACTN|nr:phosphonoacetaldehyde reductase [Natronosporangium hydrolyticum]QSB15225.1 phosphonoacetaldehyde reductase [Natronosporangium hydrolyticum]